MIDDIREDIQAALDGAPGDTSGTTDAPAEVPAPEAVGGGDEGVAPGPEATGDTPAATPGDETPEARASAAERARDGKGRFAPKGPGAPPAPVARGGAPAPQGEAGKAPPVAATPPAAPEALRPPQSWKPAAREEWAKVPPAIQAEVHRREKEASHAIQEGAGARKFAEAFNQVLQPHSSFIHQVGGGDPVRTVGNLLQTAQSLRGPQRAQVVAQLVKQFDVPLQELNDAIVAQLQGQPTPQAQQTQQEFRDPRFDQLMAQINQTQAEKIHREIDDFAGKHEFYKDVQQDMADLVEASVRRGSPLNLDEAYTRACRMNPDVWDALQQREAAKAANATQASTQRARAASSSVRSQPATAGAAVQSGSVTDDIKAVWNKLNSR